MARVRLPKRPPIPSESEEETSDGTSESEEEMSEAEELTLPVGAAAEARIDDPGFVGSFYGVTIMGHLTSRGRGYYTVVYSTLVAEDGGPLQETVAAADVRPRPPGEGMGREFPILEAVEAFHNDGWWAGVVSAVPSLVAGAPRVYKVVLPTSRETLEFEQTALRPHQVYQAGCWVPAADVEDESPLFHEGTKVEVSRNAKIFGESWSPACVLKAIGATTFLVQYTHMGEEKKRPTEIIDSQYIRPVCTDTRVSQTCYVEVMHEGSWWPGVIREVLGSGSNMKYVVKLKSYATNMNADVLIVEYTQLRPHFDWDGKKWVPIVRRTEEGSANGTKLTSRKRPSSSAFPLYKEFGESSAKNGSGRGKKLKSADVVSELTSGSICIDNSEIMHKSSCHPEETMTHANPVVSVGSQLAPPSLPSMAGFAHSSLAGSQLEQASSQKIITSSTPVNQSRQLQASMFGTFGQPRSLAQGPVFGMQLLDSQTAKKGTAARSIDGARNIVSISADEENTLNSVHSTTTTPNNVGGLEHIVSPHGGGSAMDEPLSESLAIQHLPFVKTFPLWPRIDAMDIFSEGPQQRPHLNQFRQHGQEIHEGMAFGLMISFANLAESINRLDVEDDIEGLYEGKMQTLSLLDENGFDVGALRSRMETLLCRKNRKTLEEKIARIESYDRDLGMQMRVLGMAFHHLGLYARLVRHMIRSVVTQKISNAMEISRLKSEAKEVEPSALSTAASQ